MQQDTRQDTTLPDMTLPAEVNIKGDAADVNLVFSDNVEVTFNHENGKVETAKGRWCKICKYVSLGMTIILYIYSHILRDDNKVVQRKGMRKCFIKGGTSSCRVHIRTHYVEYSKRCKEAGVPEHPWAVPPKILREREAEAQKDGTGDTGTLKSKGFVVVPTKGPEQFSKQSVLEHTSKFIVCTDQVSRLQTPAAYAHSPYPYSPLRLPTIPSTGTA